MSKYVHLLSEQDWQDCIDFVQRTAENHSTGERTPQLKMRNMLMGKTGEFAFAHMARQFGFEAKSDLEKYEAGDTADFVINGKAIEVKTIKDNGNFLMIEPRKLQAHMLLGHTFPSAFVLALNHWNFGKQQPTRYVTLAGFIYDHDLFDLKQTSFFVRAGEQIPNTDTILRDDNFAIPLHKLRQDWSVLFHFLQV